VNGQVRLAVAIQIELAYGDGSLNGLFEDGSTYAQPFPENLSWQTHIDGFDEHGGDCSAVSGGGTGIPGWCMASN
jgi:hypothetical protein